MILTKNVVTVSVIFWDEFISNDCILMEAVLQELKTRRDRPSYNVFVCAGDFAQVCNVVFQSSVTLLHMIL